MNNRLPPALAETLTYLNDIGYTEIYLPSPAVTQPDEHTAPDRAARRSAPDRGAANRLAKPAQPPPRAASNSTDASRASGKGGEASASERAAALEVLAGQASACTACRLSEGRQSVVFGSGHANARLMLVGEGPGAEEDRQGLPFVGPAGELLTKILKAIHFERSEVYIANVVKCRPPQNRDPDRDEVTACRGFLERQIELVQPRVIVALGRVAAQALLGSTDSLGRLRGRWHTVLGVPTRATYHPAALLRYAHYKRPTWEDMQVVRDRLRELG